MNTPTPCSYVHLKQLKGTIYSMQFLKNRVRKGPSCMWGVTSRKPENTKHSIGAITAIIAGTLKKNVPKTPGTSIKLNLVALQDKTHQVLSSHRKQPWTGPCHEVGPVPGPRRNGRKMMTTFNSTVVIMATGMTVLWVLIWGVISLSLLWSSDQKHEIVDRFTWVGFWASTVPFPQYEVHKQTVQLRTHTVHTDRTSGTRRLNSSKHPHEPLAARPLKMLPRRGRVLYKGSF